MNDFVKIDGAHGEGGGQIIRSAIALSCITKKPVEIQNIRAKRSKPGLRAQHLSSIKILKKICNADVSGLEIGSTSVRFSPNEANDSNITEEIGTAGSITLILQTLIPAISILKKNIKVSIGGGTDVPWSPTSNYMMHVYHEMFQRIGINFSIKIVKRGYYPQGGGKIELKVSPLSQIVPINLTKKDASDTFLYCSFSKIPSEIIQDKINWIKAEVERKNHTVTTHVVNETALDSGSSFLLFSKGKESIIGSDVLYEKKNLDFHKKVVDSYFENNYGMDKNLSDMVVMPLAFCKEQSVFRVNHLTEHLQTNLYVSSKFSSCKYGIGKIENGFEVRIQGTLDSGI